MSPKREEVVKVSDQSEAEKMFVAYLRQKCKYNPFTNHSIEQESPFKQSDYKIDFKMYGVN